MCCEEDWGGIWTWAGNTIDSPKFIGMLCGNLEDRNVEKSADDGGLASSGKFENPSKTVRAIHNLN